MTPIIFLCSVLLSIPFSLWVDLPKFHKAGPSLLGFSLDIIDNSKKALLKFMNDVTPFTRDAHVIDFGCASGSFLLSAIFFDAVRTVTGYDVCQNAIKVARSNLEVLLKTCTLQQMNHDNLENQCTFICDDVLLLDKIAGTHLYCCTNSIPEPMYLNVLLLFLEMGKSSKNLPVALFCGLKNMKGQQTLNLKLI